MNPVYFLSFVFDDPEEPAPPIESLSPGARERIIVLAAIGVIILAAFAWAAFIRRRRKRKHHFHRHSSSSLRSQAAAAKDEISRMLKHRDRRKRLRHHRPRNPTLAETGGLPPPHQNSPPGPPALSS